MSGAARGLASLGARTNALLDRPLLAALLLFACFSGTSWVRPLMLPDEGRYVGVAWEMLRSGDWLTPTLNGMAYFHKPPLFYWLTAGSMSLFGENAWAARLAPALGATLAALSLHALVRRWLSAEAAQRAVQLLLAQPLFFIAAQYANLDMLVAGLITATIVALAHAGLSCERGLPWRGALRLAWVAAALGVLAKGLIGIVIPMGVIGAWLLIRRQWRVLARLLWCPEGLVLFVAIAAPWFMAMQHLHPGFFDYFFVYQHFTRFSTGGFNNQQPLWFYPAVITLFFSPWLYWVLRGLRARNQAADAAQGALISLWWIWAVIVIAFFSLPKSKLLGYVLPAVAPVVMLVVTGLLADDGPGIRARRAWTLIASLTLLGSLATVAAFGLNPVRSTQELARVLGEQRGPDDPVIMLGRYDFDLPMQAKLTRPMVVVDEWQSPEVRRRDNWRKELADATQFSPEVARATLISGKALPEQLCSAAVSWLVGGEGAEGQWPALDHAERMYASRGSVLWRFDSGSASGRALCQAPTR